MLCAHRHGGTGSGCGGGSRQTGWPSMQMRLGQLWPSTSVVGTWLRRTMRRCCPAQLSLFLLRKSDKGARGTHQERLGRGTLSWAAMPAQSPSRLSSRACPAQHYGLHCRRLRVNLATLHTRDENAGRLPVFRFAVACMSARGSMRSSEESHCAACSGAAVHDAGGLHSHVQEPLPACPGAATLAPICHHTVIGSVSLHRRHRLLLSAC